MKKQDYYDGPKGCEKKAIIIVMVIMTLLSSCAYSKYHARSFHPKDKADCRVYSDVDGRGMRHYYKHKDK